MLYYVGLFEINRHILFMYLSMWFTMFQDIASEHPDRFLVQCYHPLCCSVVEHMLCNMFPQLNRPVYFLLDVVLRGII
jgi:hypothetical protein